MQIIISLLKMVNSLFIFLFVIHVFIKAIGLVKEMFKAREDRQKNKIIDFKAYMGKENMIPVSIIVPVQGQPADAISCIEMLLDVDYRSKEIIVVSEGLNENITDAIMERFELEEIEHAVKQTVRTNSIRHIYYNSKYPEILYVDKRRGGMADAVNCGINVSQCPLYICIEPGMKIEKDALLKLSFEFFKDSSTIYSCGVTRIVEPTGRTGYRCGMKMIECLNMTAAAGADREVSQELFAPLSGAFALIQKQAALDVGGYRSDCDSWHYDLLLRVQKHVLDNRRQMEIVTQRNVVSRVDTNTGQEEKKPNRHSEWQKGIVNALNKQLVDVFSFKKYKSFSSKLLYNYTYNVIYVIIEALAYLTLPVAALFEVITWQQYLIFLAVYTLLRILYNLSSVNVDLQLNEGYIKPKKVFAVLFYSILEVFGYHQIIIIKRALSIVGYVLTFRRVKTDAEISADAATAAEKRKI